MPDSTQYQFSDSCDCGQQERGCNPECSSVDWVSFPLGVNGSGTIERKEYGWHGKCSCGWNEAVAPEEKADLLSQLYDHAEAKHAA